LYAKNPSFVVPDFRLNEAKSLIAGGLEDFSISRVAAKMPWGIAVPTDADQVMYVWFDALVDYISAVGWPDDTKSFKKWWTETGGVVQYCGKDQIRQQAVMWQAMLMAADLPSSKNIVVDGFITGEGGLKMSKSLGNTVDPFAIVADFGTDALRYYCARELSPFEDSPFTPEKFKEAYNAGLANGLGNLTSRILKLTSDYKIVADLDSKENVWKGETGKHVWLSLERFNIQDAANEVWKMIAEIDKTIQASQPFKSLKSEDKDKVKEGTVVMKDLQAKLWQIAILLEPIMPETALKIQSLVTENKMPDAPLFLRK
jgi:methionyl-tRNA synthetase